MQSSSALFSSTPCIFPKALQPGDTVAIVSPAGPTKDDALFTKGIRLLENRGYRVKLMPNTKAKTQYLAGTDDQRLSDLHAAFADADVDAILCARGGYGSMRLLPFLDFELIAEHPKLLMGFSDITALLLPINQRTGLLGFHAPMLTSNLVDEDTYTWEQWLNVVTGQVDFPYTIPNTTPYQCLQPGQAEGRLVGGNLSLLAALCGTPYQPDTDGAILFIEDWHESYYSLDRQFRQLQLAGLFKGIAGLVLCDFCELDEEDTSSLPLPVYFQHLIDSLRLNQSIPVGLGYSIGHGERTATVPIGASAAWNATAGTLTLMTRPVR